MAGQPDSVPTAMEGGKEEVVVVVIYDMDIRFGKSRNPALGGISHVPLLRGQSIHLLSDWTSPGEWYDKLKYR